MADKPGSRRETAPALPNIGISEFATEVSGALSPFGSLQLPIPLDLLTYQHPGPEDRPRLVVDQH